MLYSFSPFKVPTSSSQDARVEPPCFNTKSSLRKEVLLDHIRGTIYGNCIGDAIGLLTEFMTKREATHVSCFKFNSFSATLSCPSLILN